jgi:2-polyprenyl-3-methyl-5-hydroxy-6-metoxy-1,4-benzoquinol methylase
VNFKLLFPTYRTRERWVHEVLGNVGKKPLGRMLNVGAGEGDIDAALASYATELESCDVNEDDVAHARALNAGVPNVRYSVQDGESLSFDDASFDVVTCLEVIEHVTRPMVLLGEIARVLKPGGVLVLTCPSVRFPVTYDPVNATLAALPGRAHLPVGAYAYGHSWLVDQTELELWLEGVDLRIERKDKLSGWLVGAMECYWPGLLQRALKANAGNTTKRAESSRSLRPSTKTPPLVGAVDALIALDRRLSARSPRSVGLGYVVRKIATRS